MRKGFMQLVGIFVFSSYCIFNLCFYIMLEKYVLDYECQFCNEIIFYCY